MHLRRSSALAVGIALVGALCDAAPVHAAVAGTTLYVNNTTSACTDAGAGTQAAPFCTIQAAANVAVGGDTVSIAAGRYAGTLNITQSGTSGSPITFQGVSTSQPGSTTSTVLGNPVVGQPTVTFASGVHDLVFRGITLYATTAVDLADVSNTTFDGDFIHAYVNVSGASAGDAFERSDFAYGLPRRPSLTVGSGVTGLTVSTNIFEGGVLISGAYGTSVTSNAIWTGGGGITVTGGSGNTSIENNELALGGTSVFTALSVAADSTATTSEKYNTLIPVDASTTEIPYSWAGTAYTTVAGYQEVSGQGAADLIASADGHWYPMTSTWIDASLIGSADSGAPGELSTDYFGNAPIRDPLVPCTGTGANGPCYDRGPVQIQDPFSSNPWVPDPDANSSLTVDGVVGQYPHIAWGPVTETFSWGDGTSTTVNVTNLFSTPRPIVTHPYAKPGVYTISGSTTDGIVTVPIAGQTFATPGTAYTPVAPSRVLDTRFGVGAAQAQVPAGGSIPLTIAGVDGLPASGIAAAVLNVTVTDESAIGYISVGPSQDGLSAFSNINFLPGRNTPNLVTTQVGSDGRIWLYNASSNPVDLVADLEGFYDYTGASGYVTLAPSRVLDTRNGTGATKNPVASGGTIGVQFTGVGGVPKTGVTAVALNLTAVDATSFGAVTAYPSGLAAVPTASNLNYAAGQTIANMAIVPVGSDGQIDFQNSSPGSVDLVADVEGYYTTSGGLHFVPVSPERIIDGRSQFPVPSNRTATYFTDLTGIQAYVMNVTVTDGTSFGALTVFPWVLNGGPVPTASNINWTAGENVANQVIEKAGESDQFSFFNSSPGTVDVIADLFGYFN